MQSFYETWKFKHPQPSDFQKHIQQATGESLEWLFEGYLYSTENLDYSISKVQKQNNEAVLTITNLGSIAAPIPIAAMVDTQMVHLQWVEGFLGKKQITIPGGDFDKIVIDPFRISLDRNRKNNQFNKSAFLSKKAPLNFQVIPAIENDQRNTVFIWPVLAWNNYDKTMLGLAITNLSVPNKNFEFGLAPMYGFGSKDLSGLGLLQYSWYPSGNSINRISLGLSGKSFHYNYFPTFDFDLKYIKLTPFLKFELGSSPTKRYQHFLQWRSINLHTQGSIFTANGFEGIEWNQNWIHELRYNRTVRQKINPSEIDIRLEYQDYQDFDIDQSYLRLSLEYQYSFTYKRGKNINFRFFAGSLLRNTKRTGGTIFPGAFNLSSQGFIFSSSVASLRGADYKLDDFYFGRNENEGLWSQQISLREGGFKTPIGSTNLAFGRSNDYILSLNLSADLPFSLPLSLPLKPYFDIGYFNDRLPVNDDFTTEDQILWSGGIMLDFLDGTIGIYFPIVNKKEIKNLLEMRGNYWTRITFSFDLNQVNPFELIHQIEP